jgi:hypothetical protein
MVLELIWDVVRMTVRRRRWTKASRHKRAAEFLPSSLLLSLLPHSRISPRDSLRKFKVSRPAFSPFRMFSVPRDLRVGDVHLRRCHSALGDIAAQRAVAPSPRAASGDKHGPVEPVDKGQTDGCVQSTQFSAGLEDRARGGQSGHVVASRSWTDSCPSANPAPVPREEPAQLHGAPDIHPPPLRHGKDTAETGGDSSRARVPGGHCGRAGRSQCNGAVMAAVGQDEWTDRLRTVTPQGPVTVISEASL